jgi:hypothetical protein
MLAYMVVRGSYDDYQPLRVFADQGVALEWALRYNAAHPWQFSGDEARVEEIGFTPAGMSPPPVDGPVVVDVDYTS